jgi:hypothetical protein
MIMTLPAVVQVAFGMHECSKSELLTKRLESDFKSGPEASVASRMPEPNLRGGKTIEPVAAVKKV